MFNEFMMNDSLCRTAPHDHLIVGLAAKSTLRVDKKVYSLSLDYQRRANRIQDGFSIKYYLN